MSRAVNLSIVGVLLVVNFPIMVGKLLPMYFSLIGALQTAFDWPIALTALIGQ